MRLLNACIILLLVPYALTAQAPLAGLWKGEITFGGLHSQKSYPFELFLEVDDDQLKGRTYIHIGSDDIIEMEVLGRIYFDRSLSLREYEFIPVEGSQVLPPFSRKYQMIFNRSVFGSTIEGYWQQDHIEPFNVRRDRGRIRLEKMEASKA